MAATSLSSFLTNRLTNRGSDGSLRPWLVGIEPEQFQRQVITQQPAIFNQRSARPLVIAEKDPLSFLATLLAALSAGCDVALANPDWGQQEWQQVSQQLPPDFQRPPTWSPESHLLIPTGGTSGRVRFVVHTESTLLAAVQGFLEAFSKVPLHAYCVLPLYHVSGLMQVLRTGVSQGQLVVQSFKALAAGERLVQPDQMAAQSWVISLVPTQLHRLLSLPPASPLVAGTTDWLAQFQAVFLGGGPVWPALLAQAQAAGIPVALTYGMTETAAQITTLMPSEFAAGNRSSGRHLPHAQVQIHTKTRLPVAANQVGQIAIQSQSLSLGYLDSPLNAADGWFYPDDQGYLDPEGYLHVVGRTSHKIISGGENIFPSEVEAALLATGQVKDVCVLGLPDADWGQIVAALYVPQTPTVTAGDLAQALRGRLSRYKHPKRWYAIAQLPRNSQGKINRQQVQALWTTDQSTPTTQDQADAVDDWLRLNTHDESMPAPPV